MIMEMIEGFLTTKELARAANGSAGIGTNIANSNFGVTN